MMNYPRKFKDEVGNVWVCAVDFARLNGISDTSLYGRYFQARKRAQARVLPFFRKEYPSRQKQGVLYIREDYVVPSGHYHRPNNARILEDLYFKYIDEFETEAAFIRALFGGARRWKDYVKYYIYLRMFRLKTARINRELSARVLVNIEGVKWRVWRGGSLVVGVNGLF